MAAAEAEAKAVYSEVVSDSEVAMRRSAQGRFRLMAVERAPEATEREVVVEGELAQERGAEARAEATGAEALAVAPTDALANDLLARVFEDHVDNLWSP